MYHLRNKIIIFVLILLAAGSAARGFAFEYESYGRRDPFVPLVGVAAEGTMGGLQGVVAIEDISFQGVVIGADGRRAAILNGELFKEGDMVGDIAIESVGQNEVSLKLNKETHKLKLYE